MLRCSGDDTFGPVLGSAPIGCYNFDFTLLFEEAIFTIAPCALVLPLAAWRLFRVIRRPVLVQWPIVHALKFVRPISQLSHRGTVLDPDTV
jgi:ATP-binding cassette, subfamily C (CFTR/MRP), member 1